MNSINSAFNLCVNLHTFHSSANAITCDNHAFATCESLLVLATTLLHAGKGCFKHCSSLESVAFSDDMKIVNENAFLGCNFKNMDFNNVEHLEKNCMMNCTALKSVTFYGSDVGSYALSGCTMLASVHMPNARELRDRAFQNCSSLKSGDFPCCRAVRRNCFEFCSSMESLTLNNALFVFGVFFRFVSEVEFRSSFLGSTYSDAVKTGCT